MNEEKDERMLPLLPDSVGPVERKASLEGVSASLEKLDGSNEDTKDRKRDGSVVGIEAVADELTSVSSTEGREEGFAD